MIIECQTCHARFRLDESRIREGRTREVPGNAGTASSSSRIALPLPRRRAGTVSSTSAPRCGIPRARSRTPPPVGNLIPFPGPAPAVEPGARDLFFQALNATGTGKRTRWIWPSTGSSRPAWRHPPRPSGKRRRRFSPPREADALVEPEAPSGPVARPDLDLGALTLDLGRRKNWDLPPAAEPEQPPGGPSAAEPSTEFRGEGAS